MPWKKKEMKNVSQYVTCCSPQRSDRNTIQKIANTENVAEQLLGVPAKHHMTDRGTLE